MRESYRKNEVARMNLFIRHKYWDPTVYTVANTSVESTTIQSASYRVYRLLDAYEVVPYNTGTVIDSSFSIIVGLIILSK